jgi:hypothetical protein
LQGQGFRVYGHGRHETLFCGDLQGQGFRVYGHGRHEDRFSGIQETAFLIFLFYFEIGISRRATKSTGPLAGTANSKQVHPKPSIFPHQVATCGADDSVMVFAPIEGGSWKVAGCKVGAHVGDVNGVKWRPGSRGKHLASVGDDGTIKLWSVPE